jgi:hypothetical protein
MGVSLMGKLAARFVISATLQAQQNDVWLAASRARGKSMFREAHWAMMGELKCRV